MVTRRDNRDNNNDDDDNDDSSLFRFQRRRHAGGCCYWGDGNQGGSRHGRHGSRRLQCWFALALVTFLVFEKVMVTVFFVVQEAPPPPPLSSSSLLSLSSSSSLFFHRPESNVVNKVSASSSTSSSSSLPCPTHFYRDDHGSGSSSSTHNTEREEILLESLSAQARQQKVVIVFVCNARYAPAVASSIVSVRIDGGYTGDIAVILEESHNFTVADLKRWIRMEEEAATVAATAAPTVTTNHRPDQQWAEQVHVVDTKRLFFYTVSSLMDSLLLLLLVQENDPNRRPNSSSSLSLDYLRHAPMASSCKNEYRTARQLAYYHKPLIYHPTFLQWHRVLYMDACMTFHLPLVSDLFTLPSISPQQQPVLLAAPDPWPWSQHGLWGQVLKCERNNLTRGVQTLVDMVRRHNVYYDYDDPNHQKELEQERAKVAKKQKLQQQKQRRQRNLPMQSQDNPRLVGQKNHIHNNYTFLHAPADQNPPDLEYARWVLRHAPYFNSALILYDTAILRRNDQPFDHADDDAAADHAAAASTLVELYQLYHTLGQVFRGGDQCIQSVYWMYLQRQKHQSQQQQQQQQLQQQPLASTSRSSSGSVYQLLPLQMVGQNNLVPYEFWSRFLPHIPRIITSGHATRPVCRERRTNQWMLKHNQNHNNNNNKNNHKKQK